MGKIKDPNPLNFLELRQLKVPPGYFEYILLPQRYNLQESITKWIYENLKGRFYIGKAIDLDNNEHISSMLKVGFEDTKEMSYFTLACPHLKYK